MNELAAFGAVGFTVIMCGLASVVVVLHQWLRTLEQHEGDDEDD